MNALSLAPVEKQASHEEICVCLILDATERISSRLRGRPAWEMSRADQMNLARLSADYLRARGAAQVWLFGSVAVGRRLGVHSDFDFAIEGLPPELFLGSLGRLLQCLPLPVDLVNLESVDGEFRRRIVGEGLVL